MQNRQPNEYGETCEFPRLRQLLREIAQELDYPDKSVDDFLSTCDREEIPHSDTTLADTGFSETDCLGEAIRAYLRSVCPFRNLHRALLRCPTGLPTDPFPYPNNAAELDRQAKGLSPGQIDAIYGEGEELLQATKEQGIYALHVFLCRIANDTTGVYLY